MKFVSFVFRNILYEIFFPYLFLFPEFSQYFISIIFILLFFKHLFLLVCENDSINAPWFILGQYCIQLDSLCTRNVYTLDTLNLFQLWHLIWLYWRMELTNTVVLSIQILVEDEKDPASVLFTDFHTAFYLYFCPKRLNCKKWEVKHCSYEFELV